MAYNQTSDAMHRSQCNAFTAKGEKHKAECIFPTTPKKLATTASSCRPPVINLADDSDPNNDNSGMEFSRLFSKCKFESPVFNFHYHVKE